MRGKTASWRRSDFFCNDGPHWLTTLALARGAVETARIFRGGRALVLRLYAIGPAGEAYVVSLDSEVGSTYFSTVTEARDAFLAILNDDERRDWRRLKSDVFHATPE